MKNDIKIEASPSMKLWRTLIRIKNFDKDKIGLVVPGWNHTETIYLNRNMLPLLVNDILNTEINLPYRLFAKCNIGNDNKNELIFTDWEIL